MLSKSLAQEPPHNNGRFFLFEESLALNPEGPVAAGDQRRITDDADRKVFSNPLQVDDVHKDNRQETPGLLEGNDERNGN